MTRTALASAILLALALPAAGQGGLGERAKKAKGKKKVRGLVFTAPKRWKLIKKQKLLRAGEYTGTRRGPNAVSAAGAVSLADADHQRRQRGSRAEGSPDAGVTSCGRIHPSWNAPPAWVRYSDASREAFGRSP